MLVPINKNILKDNIGGYIEIINEPIFMNFFTFDQRRNLQIIVYFSQAEFYEINFNQIANLRTKFCDFVDIKVIPRDIVIDSSLSNREQFILETSVQIQMLKGDEDVQMHINFNTDFPSKNNQKDFVSNGNIGQGLIKTIKETDKEFCIKDCAFYVTLILVNINQVEFYPTIFANMQKIQLTQNVFFMDELKKQEVIGYNFQLPTQFDQDIDYIKLPTEGDINFGIEFSDVSKQITNWDIYIDQKEKIELIISNKWLNSNFPNQTNFYLQIQNTEMDISAFNINIKLIKKMELKFINLNDTYLGKIDKEEIMFYYLDLNDTKDNTHFLNLKMKLKEGKGEIFIKNCVQIYNCTMKIAEIEQHEKKGNIAEGGKIFRFSKENQLDKSGQYIGLNQMFLNFNCIGTKSPHFENKYTTLKSCQFIIGIKAYKENSIFYELNIQGDNNIHILDTNQAVSITNNPSETITFSIEINQKQKEEFQYIIIKGVSLIGYSVLFYSKSNKNLDQYDYDQKIDFDRQEKGQYQTYEKTIVVNIKEIINENIYIKLWSLTYTIIDIYASFSNQLYIETEKLLPNIVNHRSFDEEHIKKTENSVTFKKLFYLEVEEKIEQNFSFQVILTSPYKKMKICAQLKIRKIDTEQPCDYESDSNILEIFDADKIIKQGSFIALSVEKEMNFFTSDQIKPFEFTITVRMFYKFSNEIPQLNLVQPGTIFTQIIKPQEKLYFSMDFELIKNQGVISLTTFNHAIKGDIMRLNEKNQKTENIIATLDTQNFAFVVKSESLFGEINAIYFSHKYVILLRNDGDKASRISLMYTFDDIPVQIEDGSGIHFPTNLQLFFQFRNLQSNIFNLNISSEKTLFESFLTLNEKILDNQQISFRVNQDKFDFKTDVNTFGEISISSEILQNKFYNSVDILFSPKGESVNIDTEGTLVTFEEKGVITINTEMKEIYPFEHVKERGMKGEMKYFYFVLDEPQTVLITLTVISGESDIYIGQGFNNLPTTNNYWKKSGNYKGDEIELKPSMFKSDIDMIGIYTIGVYSRVYSSFSLVFAPDFGKIFYLKYQHLMDLQIQPDEFYYLYFHNKYENFTTYLFSQKGEIEISVLDYNFQDKVDFLQLINNDSNYSQKFTFHQGDPPRIQFLSNENENKSRFVIRMKSNQETIVIFSIFDSEKPLEVFAEKRFDFSMNEKSTQIFEVRLDSSYDKIDLDVKLNFGDISFEVSDDLNFKGNSTTLNNPDQKYLSHFADKSSNTDVVIFEKVFIKIISNIFSSFSILIKPEDKFKKLREFETELIYTNKDKDQYLFFSINEKQKQKIHSIVFNIKMVSSYDGDPELFFMPDSNITLSKDSPFIPMPLIDLIKKNHGQFSNLVIRPSVLVGYYVIKFLKNEQEIPFKISVSLNNQKGLQVNGFYQEFLPISKSSPHLFSIYYSEKGNYRILFESCAAVTITNAEFISQNNKSQQINLDQKFYQSINFIEVDEISYPQKTTYKKVLVNVYRGEITEPGLLKITVGLKNNVEEFKAITNKQNFYDIISEFTPINKSLILNDYIDLEEDGINIRKSKFQTQFTEKERNLQIGVEIPNFKDQIFLDYPNLQKIRIVFNFYLLNNDENNFDQKFDQCGESTLEQNYLLKKDTQRILTKSEINSHYTVAVKFLEEELNSKYFSKFIHIFVSLDVTLIENDYDYYGITLDEKFFTSPYVYMKIQNVNFKQHYILKIIGISFILIFMLVLFCCFQEGKKNIPDAKITYEKKSVEGNVLQNRVEMSDVSSANIMEKMEDKEENNGQRKNQQNIQNDEEFDDFHNI